MKVTLKHKGKDILTFETEFDPGFGHLMVVLGCLFDTLKNEQIEAILIEVSAGIKKAGSS